MFPAFRISARTCRTALRRSVHSTIPANRLPPMTRPNVGLLGFAAVGGTLYFYGRIHADGDTGQDKPARQPTSLSNLLRSYTVYALCSVPTLVDYSPALLAALTSVPGVKQVTEAIVRSTFFAQFVGGDTAQDTVPLMAQMRADNKGVLLAYSVEVDQDVAEGMVEKRIQVQTTTVHKQNVEETIRCIDVAADFEEQRGPSGTLQSGRKTWVAVKLTALVPSAHALINLSDHLRQTRPKSSPPVPFPGCPHVSDLAFIESGASPPPNLSQEDMVALKDLHYDLHRIGEQAAKRGVKIIVDAEYSWYQPAIDAYTLSLMRRFNALPKSPESTPPVQPLVYGSYQAYLRRTPSHILQSLDDARAGGYALGVKLVRGAYHTFEVDASPSPEACPVWAEKEETDACYNQCVALLLSAVRRDIAHKLPRLGILFGTHNSQSCDRILEGLVREGIAEDTNGIVVVGEAVAERCVIGQLYGMSDALTNKLVDRIRSPSPFVIKYVPYGPLSAVMPYLSRRAIENKSVLSGEGGAVAERRRVGTEIRRKILGF